LEKPQIFQAVCHLIGIPYATRRVNITYYSQYDTMESWNHSPIKQKRYKAENFELRRGKVSCIRIYRSVLQSHMATLKHGYPSPEAFEAKKAP